MILFCDTSALVKLYLEEAGSDAMRSLGEAASALAVCRISWAEIAAAFARRGRETRRDARILDAARSRVRRDWADYAVVEITQPLVELAGEYAETFALSGCDSVQLAAARTLQRAADEDVCFACFDMPLQRCAQVLGMKTTAPAAGVTGR